VKLASLVAVALVFAAAASASPVVDAVPAPAAALPSAPAPAAASIFGGAGVLIANPGAVDPRVFGRLMRANGFAWAAVEVHDGGLSLNREAFALGWADRLRELGILVGGWGVLRDDPERDAAAAATAIAEDRLAFYIADAEFSYSAVGGDPGRSSRFVPAFRGRVAPGLPVALSSFGRVDGAYGFDWAAWRAGRFEYLPQSYLVDGNAFAPARGIAAALSIWPRSMIHPTIGLYGGVTASDYGPGLEHGFSVFPGELMSAADFAQLGRYAP
jgi:hypothetical protein